jgi:hypothetical protein
MQSIILRKTHGKAKLDSLEYLSGVFKELSVERKDRVLNAARSLLKIQDDDACFLPDKKSACNENQGIENFPF